MLGALIFGFLRACQGIVADVESIYVWFFLVVFGCLFYSIRASGNFTNAVIRWFKDEPELLENHDELSYQVILYGKAALKDYKDFGYLHKLLICFG